MTKEQKELALLEERKVKALEKISASLESLTVWFEVLDTEEWSKRIQYYLSEFHKIGIDGMPEKVDEKK